MRWHSTSWQTKMSRLELWHRWYAWYPVRIGEQYAWLEEVERKLVLTFESWNRHYRFPE